MAVDREACRVVAQFNPMVATAATAVPAFDYAALADGRDLDRLRQALCSVGFIQVSNHPVSELLVDTMFSQSAAFFSSGTDAKSRFAYDKATNVGWLTTGSERLNGQNAKTELKEALNLPKHTANLSLPDHISREPVTRFTSLCHATCLGLLRAFAACLDIPRDAGGHAYFADRHRFDEPSGDTLRLLDYPPLPPGADINDWTRAGGHSDFGSLTLLFTQPGDQGGLELLMRGRDGQEEFVQVPTIPGHVIVNTGDVMEFWTAGLFRSTVHRVTIPSKEAAESHRYSIAYFCHPEDSARLDPIPSLFVSDSSSDSYGSSSPSRTASALFEDAAIAKVGGVRPRTAREHLLLRLQRIHA